MHASKDQDHGDASDRDCKADSQSPDLELRIRGLLTVDVEEPPEMGRTARVSLLLSRVACARSYLQSCSANAAPMIGPIAAENA